MDNTTGYVYLFEEIDFDGAPTGLYKIGKTTQDVESRRRQVQTGNVRKIDICYFAKVSDCHAVERELHDRLANYRINRDGGTEWFDFGGVDLQSVVDLMKEYQPLPIVPPSTDNLVVAGCFLGAVMAIALLSILCWVSTTPRQHQQLKDLIHLQGN